MSSHINISQLVNGAGLAKLVRFFPFGFEHYPPDTSFTTSIIELSIVR